MGISTLVISIQDPNSIFYAYDNHVPSIEAAKTNVKIQNIEKMWEFLALAANEHISADFDLKSFFDCLHYMNDPLGALKFIKQSLKENRSCMIVEPMASKNIEYNLNLMAEYTMQHRLLYVFQIL